MMRALKISLFYVFLISAVTLILAPLLEGIEAGLNFLMGKWMVSDHSYFLLFAHIVLISFTLCLVLIGVIFIFFCKKKENNRLNLVPAEDQVLAEAQAEEVLERFLNLSTRKDALMIEAEWGAGKTSFYKYSLKPKLEIKFPKHKIIEVSCFGIGSKDELVNKILNSVGCLELFSIFFMFIRQFLNRTTEFKQGFIPENLIIVLDDFERASSGLYKEILGLIDYLKENKNCHFLILCNEDEINNDEYNKMAEKVLTKYEFTPRKEQLENILKNNEIPDEAIDSFLTLAESVKNIRSIIRTSYEFKEVTGKIRTHCQSRDGIDTKHVINSWFNQCNRELALMYIRNIGKTADFEVYREELEKIKLKKSTISYDKMEQDKRFSLFYNLQKIFSFFYFENELTDSCLMDNYLKDGVKGITEENIAFYVENVQYANIESLYNDIFYKPFDTALQQFKSAIISDLNSLGDEIKIEYKKGGASEPRHYALQVFYTFKILLILELLEQNDELVALEREVLKKLINVYGKELKNIPDIDGPQGVKGLAGKLITHLLRSPNCSDEADEKLYNDIVHKIKADISQAVEQYMTENIAIASSEERSIDEIALAPIADIESYAAKVKQDYAPEKAIAILESLVSKITRTDRFHVRLKKMISTIIAELKNKSD